jgi:hypothetical protein
MITPNVNQSLSDIFDVELTQTDKSIGELKISAKVDSIDSLETRREYVKGNIISLIEKGIVALDSLTTIANSTELSKDFGEVTKLIKTLVDTNMTLLECEVIHKQPIGQSDTSAQSVTNNTVFVGSTSDLSKYIRESSNIIENK